MFYYGIDLGGTKIESLALNAGGERVVGRRTPSPRDNYEATVRAIAEEVQWLDAQTGGQGHIGIGIPGCVSPQTGLIKNANSTWLIGKNFAHDLAVAIGREVRLANDANCFTLSEATDGAAKDYNTVWGIILGTGTGSGLVINGKVLTGKHGIAGEYGHNRLPDPDNDEQRFAPQCYCGEKGCIETWISGPGLSADHKRMTGQVFTAEEIYERSLKGDANAIATLDRHVSRVARAFAGMINHFDPDVIVLGGGLSKMEHLYTHLPDMIAKYVFAANPAAREKFVTPIKQPYHGDASGVRGAAWLWQNNSIESFKAAKTFRHGAKPKAATA